VKKLAVDGEIPHLEILNLRVDVDEPLAILETRPNREQDLLAHRSGEAECFIERTPAEGHTVGAHFLLCRHSKLCFDTKAVRELRIERLDIFPSLAEIPFKRRRSSFLDDFRWRPHDAASAWWSHDRHPRR
jgi:hypothetical protein